MRPASAASPSITGMIGCSPGTSRKPSAASRARNQARVLREPACAAPRSDSSRSSTAQRRRRDDRRDGVREQVGPRALAQPADDGRAAGHVAAARAAERLAERAGQDVDAAHDAAVLVRAAPAGAHEPGRVRVVDHDQSRRGARRGRRCRASGAIMPSIENTPSVTMRRVRASRGLDEPRLELARSPLS